MTRALKALPELLSAALLLALWIEPQRFGTEWFRAGVLTLLLEFFVLNAGGFMAFLMYDPETAARKRSLQVAALGAGYLVLISAFAFGFDAWWMLGAFAWLIFGKLQAIWTGAPPTERDRMYAGGCWALSVAVFLGAVLLSVMVYPLPPLGAGPEFRDAAGFNAKGGVYEAEPHRALAGAVLYFTLMGLSRPFLAWAYAVRTAAETGPVRGQVRNVHPVSDRRMWISLGVFVLVIAVLFVIEANMEWVLAWLAGN